LREQECATLIAIFNREAYFDAYNF